MSGSLDGIIAAPQGIDVLSGLKKWTDYQQSQAQAALTGQQAQGAAIGNQLAALNVARRGYQLDQLGIPGLNPNGQPGAGPFGLPGAAGAPGGAPGAPGAPGGGGAPGQAGGGAAAASYPGQAGDTAFGYAAPAYETAMARTADDPIKAQNDLSELRRQTLYAAVAGAPPEQYPAAMMKLYQAGWLSPAVLQDALAHPEGRARLLQVTQSPEQYQTMLAGARQQGMGFDAQGNEKLDPTAIGAHGATAEAGAAGSARGNLPYAEATARAGAAGTAAGSGSLVNVNVTNPDGTVTAVPMLPEQARNYVATHQSAELAPGADQGLLGNFKSSIFGQESSSGADTRTSDKGAAGAWQVTPQFFKQYARPGEDFGSEADRIVVAQRGIDALWARTGGDPLRTAVGYFSGPDNIAPPGSPNPWVKDKSDGHTTTSQYVRGVMQRMFSGGPAAAGGAAPPAAAGGPAAAPGAAGAPPPAAAPGGGGAAAAAPPAAPVATKAAPTVAGVPELPPLQKAAVETAKGNIAKDQATVDAGMGALSAAQQQQINLTQLRNTGGQINSGAYGEAVQGVQNYLATWAPEFAQKFVANLTAGKVDPAKAGATQEFVKLALQAASQAEKANNPQGGLGITQVYTSAYPNLETQPTAIRDMSNLFLINQQRVIDHANGAAGFVQRQIGPGGAAQTDPRAYNALRNYDQEFAVTNSPQVYVAAAAALNNKPYGEWAKGLNLDQQKAALGVLWRADPTAVVMDARGQPRHNPALAQPGGG